MALLDLATLLCLCVVNNLPFAFVVFAVFTAFIVFTKFTAFVAFVAFTAFAMFAAFTIFVVFGMLPSVAVHDATCCDTLIFLSINNWICL